MRSRDFHGARSLPPPSPSGPGRVDRRAPRSPARGTHLGVRELAHGLALAGVHERADLCVIRGGRGDGVEEASAARASRRPRAKPGARGGRARARVKRKATNNAIPASATLARARTGPRDGIGRATHRRRYPGARRRSRRGLRGRLGRRSRRARRASDHRRIPARRPLDRPSADAWFLRCVKRRAGDEVGARALRVEAKARTLTRGGRSARASKCRRAGGGSEPEPATEI